MQQAQPAKIEIPKTLTEAVLKIEDMIPEEERKWVRSVPESEMVSLHFGVGRWIRNNWGLWSGGPLADWFKERGIQHPDDMSGIILDSYWRWVHDQPLKLDAQITPYREFWKEQGLDPDNLKNDMNEE